jgi:hypothetical protein
MKIKCIHIGYVLAFCVSGIFSCKKFVDKQKEKVAESVITEGTWRVSRYMSGDSNLTAGFDGYIFTFRKGGTVDGTLGTATSTGTWSVDINQRTILSNFPDGGLPVSRLNHNWKITDSYNDSVSANTLVDSTLRLLLELHKN